MSTPNYTLYYWPIAFRGQFVKVMFAYTKTPYTMGATSEMLAMKNEPSAEGGLFMGPPLLRDEEDDLWLSQMPAVVQHLARKMDLVPASGKAQSQALKILLDCNDVLGDVTRANGSQMWTQEEWDVFVADDGRFAKWLQIFEHEGGRNGMTPTAGYMTGPTLCFADLSVFVLYGTMEKFFPALGPLLRKSAPMVMAMVDRIAASTELAGFNGSIGDKWCGGQIEASIRSVLKKIYS